MYGSVRGAARKGRPYRDRGIPKSLNVVANHRCFRLVLGSCWQRSSHLTPQPVLTRGCVNLSFTCGCE